MANTGKVILLKRAGPVSLPAPAAALASAPATRRWSGLGRVGLPGQLTPLHTAP